ncbi:hypothetical protein R3P38DRAFT_2756391 [Favolaschia claudopus]|uniref:Uncharacterized protein n=1 Tax=Favolaschia claudopus TaxID=2862362 RepID=A0AAW0EFL0_9AGAR
MPTRDETIARTSFDYQVYSFTFEWNIIHLASIRLERRLSMNQDFNSIQFNSDIYTTARESTFDTREGLHVQVTVNGGLLLSKSGLKREYSINLFNAFNSFKIDPSNFKSARNSRVTVEIRERCGNCYVPFSGAGSSVVVVVDMSRAELSRYCARPTRNGVQLRDLISNGIEIKRQQSHFWCPSLQSLTSFIQFSTRLSFDIPYLQSSIRGLKLRLFRFDFKITALFDLNAEPIQVLANPSFWLFKEYSLYRTMSVSGCIELRARVFNYSNMHALKRCTFRLNRFETAFNFKLLWLFFVYYTRGIEVNRRNLEGIAEGIAEGDRVRCPETIRAWGFCGMRWGRAGWLARGLVTRDFGHGAVA